ncbi:hypothetical protein G6F48_010658 [Rhizopus delemar]|nr:hypothetical protein G6F48_010658 [Rhizopus delemar]
MLTNSNQLTARSFRHLEEKTDEQFALPTSTVDYLNLVIDGVDLKEYKKNMKDDPNEDEDVSNSLENNFRAYNQYLKDTEATLNVMLIYSFLKAVAKVVRKETSSGAELKVEETPLVAMKKQVKGYDKAHIYKADSTIKLCSLKKLEVLFLETSSHFGSEARVKSSFDHHKCLFRCLLILKTTADEFYLASTEAFSKLKVLFVHASDKTVCLWSLRFVEEDTAYELWLEGSLDLKIRFGDKIEQLPKALNFYWMMKCYLQQAVEAISEHKETLKRYRFSSLIVENLFSFTNPSILKLNEREDKAGMGKFGPFYQK